MRTLLLTVLVVMPLTALAEEPIAVRVFPAEVHLTTVRDRQSLIVQAEYASGLTEDITSTAVFALADDSAVRLENATLYPKADGTTKLIVSFSNQTVEVPITVERATDDPAISFQLDVMPVFMKSGCNTGSCHGAARGKDGFNLSLFGFDPNGDHNRLTRELGGRRINLANFEQSLMLAKATGSVPHTGGARFDKKSERYETLLRWHEAGAPNDSGDIPKVLSVELYPPTAVLNGAGATQKLTARAKYSDGTDRDVTSLAVFSSNNDNSATVSPDGIVTAAKRGESFIMARFETQTVGVHFISLPKGLEFTWNEVPENNYIDGLMHNKFKKLRIQPSGLCSDEEFLRRAFIDVVGGLPTVEEYEQFMANDDPKKREQLVDDLLGRKEFVELWVMKWAELLTIRTTRAVTYKPMLRYYNWLQERIANNVPMDQMVRELLSANGGTFANAATNYYQNETNTLKVSENVAQVFMGMRIQCAQCHNHPFDRWTMDDYYSFGAFFAQIGRKRGEDPRETIIFNSGGGEVRHKVGNRVMTPKFLGGETPDLKGRDRREVVAAWLASDDNPYFAQNLANIVWAHFFGKGIINEVDDIRVSNPAVNPELIGALSSKFSEYKYDFKRMVRDICTSRTYQLSTVTNSTNESDSTNFSHALLRRMRSEVFLDAITSVTTTKNKFRGLPNGARAVQISDGNTTNYFLTTFGRAKRETVCSCEVVMEPNLSQALHLLNGDTVQQKVAQGGVVSGLLEAEATPKQIIEHLYIRCMTRKPTERETAQLEAIINQQEDKKMALEDVFWALINSREFLFNH
ncbi:MAG: DUF1549 domain-containing protein [Pirellulaceae bacterium]